MGKARPAWPRQLGEPPWPPTSGMWPRSARAPLRSYATPSRWLPALWPPPSSWPLSPRMFSVASRAHSASAHTGPGCSWHLREACLAIHGTLLLSSPPLSWIFLRAALAPFRWPALHVMVSAVQGARPAFGHIKLYSGSIEI